MRKLLSLLIITILFAGCATEDSDFGIYAWDARGHFDGDLGSYEFRWDTDRDRRWEEDVLHFAHSLLISHPLLRDQHVITWREFYAALGGGSWDWNPGAGVFYDETVKHEFLRNINDLILRIPELDDFAILTGMSHSAAVLNDSHTVISLPAGGRLPMSFTRHFDDHSAYDHHYVASAYVGLGADIVNSRLLAINGICIDEILDRMRPIFSFENEHAFRARFGGTFINRNILRHIGVIGDEDTVLLTFRRPDGHVFDIESFFVYWLHDAPLNTHRLDTNLWFAAARSAENYWHTRIPAERLMFVRFAACFEMPDRPSHEFWSEIVDILIDEGGMRTFIVDFRGNVGGYILEGFVGFLVWAEENRELLGDVYIAVDTYTWSHGVTSAVLLRDAVGDAVIIGAPTAGSPNFFAGWRVLRLPNNGTTFTVSTGAVYTMPGYQGQTLTPDIPILRTVHDFINHNDPVIAYIRR